MNKLMGQPGYFAVRGGNTPTTVGVDLSPFKPYADLAGSSGSRVTRSGADAGHVGFVDMEGQGDRGADYDVMLAAPLLLVSKVRGRRLCTWRRRNQPADTDLMHTTLRCIVIMLYC